MTEHLKPREREILILKANGNTNAQIGAWLHIRPDVVAANLTRVYNKLGAANGVQAVAIGIAVGEIGIHEIYVLDEPEKKAA